MFEGYLEMGGVEILNSARAVGYTRTAECTVSWLQCPPCDGIKDVFTESLDYTYANVADAPWYDPNDEATHRFLGIGGISVEGIPDSTRDAEVSEAITDGGVIGPVRFGTRRMRYRVVLSADGQDALEAGVAWLNSALSATHCSMHSDGCGATDTRFFTACPPELSDFEGGVWVPNPPIEEWTLVNRNHVPNPSAEAAGAVTVVATNLHTNPSFETPAGAPTVAVTNLLTHPSFEALGAPSVVATNLATNPSFEKQAGAPVTVRTNEHIHPRMGTTETIVGWANVCAEAPMTQTANGDQFDVIAPRQATDWVGLHGEMLATTAGMPIISSVEVEVPVGYPAITLFWQWEERNDGLVADPTMPTPGPQLDGPYTTISPGEIKRISTPEGRVILPGITRGRAVLRVGGTALPVGARFILRNMMTEFAQVARPYFDGSTLNAGDWTYAWTGATDASRSIVMGLPVEMGAAVAGSGTVQTQGTDTPANRSKTIHFSVTSGGTLGVGLAANPPSGAALYTLMGRVRPKNRDQVFKPAVHARRGPAFTAPKGVWTEFRYTAAADAEAYPADTGLFVDTAGHLVGDEWDVDSVMLVAGTYTGGYFDGSTPVALRRNFHPNPRALSGTIPFTSGGASDALQLPNGVRLRCWAGSSGALTLSTTDVFVIPLAPTEPIVGSMDIEVPADQPAITMHLAMFYNEGSLTNYVGPSVTIQPGETKRLYSGIGATPPATVRPLMRINVESAMIPNQYVVARNLLFEKVSEHLPYFDGATPVAPNAAGWQGAVDNSPSYLYDPSFIYAWTGTPDASTSTQSSAAPAGVTAGRAVQLLSSAAWSSDRSRSLQIIQNEQNQSDSFARLGGDIGSGMNFGVVAGRTYTFKGKLRLTAPQHPNFNGGRARGVSVFFNGGASEVNSVPTPNVAGVHDVSLTFTVPAGTTDTAFRLYHGGYNAGEEVWWDSVMLVEGTYIGPYFDGATVDAGGNTYDWTGAVDASSSTLSVLGVAGVPVPDISQATVAQTADSPAVGATALRFTLKSTGAVMLGVTTAVPTQGGLYTLLGKVRPRTRNQQFTPRIRGTVGTPFTAPKDVWTDFRITVAAGSSGAEVTGLLIEAASGHQVGDLIDVDAVLLATGTYTGPYFDGATPDAAGFDYAWAGAAHASASTASAAGVVGYSGDRVAVMQSTSWASDRSRSIRAVPTSGDGSMDSYVALDANAIAATLQPNSVYTFSATAHLAAPILPPFSGNRLSLFVHLNGVTLVDGGDPSHQAPNEAGDHRVSVTFTTPGSLSGSNALRLYHGGLAGSGDVYWDSVMVTEGSPAPAYFDGATLDAGPERYAWEGVADASISKRETLLLNPQPPTWVPDYDDPEAAMQLEVEKLIRVMHSVKCVSGPTIEQKMHRGNAWGYILEFVLVAAVPFMFGITRPVTLSPSLPTVVQDVPFNLVPYPSAELELGTVIAAVNYSANPSVEVDATGWSHTSTGVVATDVTGARSTALSAQGAASFRSHFVATNSGSNGVVVAQNVSSTFPVAVAGARMSINMWATAQVVSGTAVISKTEVVAVWRAGSSVLRTDIVGTTPAGGGAVTGKSIAVPVGADNVVIQARATLASWSTGATVDVYADAVGASVP